MARYSDDIPVEQRKFWYFTTHGIGPGTIPKGINVLESQDGQNKKGTHGVFICLDAILNTDELKQYDLIELSPNDTFQIIEFYCDMDAVHLANIDSLLVESGTELAYMKYWLDGKEEELYIAVRGDIKIIYKGEYYFRPSEYTEELKDILKSSPVEQLEIDDFEIIDNNWCELFHRGDNYEDGLDVCDGEFGETEQEIKEYLKEVALLNKR